MSKNKENKTNVMRILEREGIEYTVNYYECDEFIDGIHTADLLGLDHKLVYKTLVAQGSSKNYYVYVIPIEKELDLKKAAKSVNEKSIQMLPLKDVTAVTGYIRGGCTAVGMKKQFPTRIDESARDLQEIIISGGKIGVQLQVKPEDWRLVSKGEWDDLCHK